MVSFLALKNHRPGPRVGECENGFEELCEHQPVEIGDQLNGRTAWVTIPLTPLADKVSVLRPADIRMWLDSADLSASVNPLSPQLRTTKLVMLLNLLPVYPGIFRAGLCRMDRARRGRPFKAHT